LVASFTVLIGCKSHGLSSAVNNIGLLLVLESRPPVVLKSPCLQLVRAERNREETLRKGQVDFFCLCRQRKGWGGQCLTCGGVSCYTNPPPLTSGQSTVHLVPLFQKMTLRWAGRGRVVLFSLVWVRQICGSGLLDVEG
jgi:hypothetical protein